MVGLANPSPEESQCSRLAEQIESDVPKIRKDLVACLDDVVLLFMECETFFLADTKHEGTPVSGIPFFKRNPMRETGEILKMLIVSLNETKRIAEDFNLSAEICAILREKLRNKESVSYTELKERTGASSIALDRVLGEFEETAKERKLMYHQKRLENLLDVPEFLLGNN